MNVEQISNAKTIHPELYVDENGVYEPYRYWLETCGLDALYQFCLERLGDLDGKRLLDCGCGIGNTAVMFSRHGAKVDGFDVDQDVLDKAGQIAEANGVSVGLSNQRFEEINYPENEFDLAFGSCVIHHVDVAEAAKKLSKVLKPGGKAVFIENSSRNPLLMLARSNIVGKFGIPKYGDDDEEHPLRDDEIETLRQNFDGTIVVHNPTLVMFRLADFYVFRGRSGAATNLMKSLDRTFGRSRWMSRLSYFQVLEFIRA